MRNSMDSGFNEVKNVKGRRGIRDGSEEVNLLGRPNRMKLGNNEDRSNSEPPRSFGSYLPAKTSSRLKPIREKNCDDAQGSSDEDGELSKSNSQLNESDFDLEIPDSASASVSQTPTPTPLASSHARRINSETNLNDSKRRLSGFMGNRSKRFCASTSELSFSSHLDTRKSLFSPKNNALSRQSFNSSLYGSNLSLSSTNSRLFMVNSPFYSGKTMFGGASAYPKRDINQHKILRTPVQMRPSSSLSNSSNTSAKSDNNMVPESSAAKRILEIMNQYSGPSKEARAMGNNISSIIKIPSLVQNRKRFGEEELNLDRSIALSSPTAPYGRPLSGKSSTHRPDSPLLNSSINKPLQIPTMSQLLQMKRLQSNTERVREIASRSDSFLNRNQEYKLPSASEDTQSNSTGSSSSSLKMKSNISKNLLRHDKNAANDQLPALPVNLPNIQLPELKSIPKFDIQLPPASTASIGFKKSPVVTKKSIITTQAPPIMQFNSFQNSPVTSLKVNSEFSFSKPTRIDNGIDGKSLVPDVEKFVFSKPSTADESVNGMTKEAIIKSPVKSSLSTTATDNLFKNLVAQQKTAKWNCDSCFAQNDCEKTNCLCCDASKPGTSLPSTKSVPSLSVAPPSDDLFKSLAAKQKSRWECSECMCSNEADKEKCVACETPKPGSKSTAQSSAPASTFSFGMPATTTQTPLVNSNKLATSNSTSFNFGTKATNDTSAAKSSFSFGMSAASAPSTNDQNFAKIVEKQNAMWECTACMTRNESKKSKCMCCEQAKPGTRSESQFSFGSKLTSTVSLPAPSEVKFSFGMQAAKVDAPPTETKLDEPEKTQSDEVDKPKQTFSFGNSSGSSTIVKSPEIAIAKPLVSEAKPLFEFKTPPTSTAGSTTFTANAGVFQIVEAQKDEPKPIEKSSTFSFGSNQTVMKEPAKIISFGSEAPETIKPITEAVKADEPKKPEFSGFNFSAGPTSVTQPPATENALNKNGGFSFGGFQSKPAVDSVKTSAASNSPSPAGGFSFGSKTNTISFGSPIATITAVPALTTNSLVFGATKTENEMPKTFGSFDLTNSSSTLTKPSFGTQSAPVFGQSSASPSGFSFSGNKEEAAPAQPSIFAFGAKPTVSATGNAPMLFGNQSNSIQNATPMFGASSVSTFGSSATNNNNNEFGSKMPSFSTNQPQKRAFEFSSANNSEMPQKRIDFGQQNQQVNSTPFQFNAQGTENKPAFNFTSTAAPSFNFTNPAANNNPQAPSSAPIVQFGASAPSQMTVPGITPFSAQGSAVSSAAANQRKILRARRATARR